MEHFTSAQAASVDAAAQSASLPNPTPAASHPGTQAVEVAYEINKILDCGLDKETLSICIGLIESGVNPEVRVWQADICNCKARTTAEPWLESINMIVCLPDSLQKPGRPPAHCILPVF